MHQSAVKSTKIKLFSLIDFSKESSSNFVHINLSSITLLELKLKNKIIKIIKPEIISLNLLKS